MKQQTLDLRLSAQQTLENFFGKTNQKIAQAITSHIEQRKSTPIFIKAAEKLGKTHLLNAVMQQMKNSSNAAIYIACKDYLQMEPNVLDHLEQYDLILIDDIDAIARLTEWEQAFFHLFNRAIAKNRQLIFTARLPANLIDLQLVDLKSRLQAALLYTLEAISEVEKKELLVAKAQQRGLNISAEVFNYLLANHDRSLPGLIQSLERIDKAALIAKRRITVPFVKKILSG
ncbi:MAG: DnaA regulatory inactivator Hda [Pseudomonadota bacterium]